MAYARSHAMYSPLLYISIHRSALHPSRCSLPQLPQADLLVVVLVENLGRRKLEILLRDVHSSLPQGIHAGLSADTLQLSPLAPIHLLRDLGQVDPTRQVHTSTVDS